MRSVMRGVSLLFVGVLAVAAWIHLDRPIVRYVISGELTELERATIARQVPAQASAGILSVDLGSVRALFGELDWVREVSVRRRWPDVLEIHVTREDAIARWGDGRYITVSGRILALPDTYDQLPLFRIAISSPQSALQTYGFVQQLVSREGLRVQTLEQNEQAEWQLQFDNGMWVYLGDQEINERMHRVLRLYRARLADGPDRIAHIDARYANGAAVKLQPQVDVLLSDHNSTQVKRGEKSDG